MILFLGNLKLDEYYNLLVHADPYGSVTKPVNRSVASQKASELEGVRAALRLYQAGVAYVPVASIPARVVPPPPPRF